MNRAALKYYSHSIGDASTAAPRAHSVPPAQVPNFRSLILVAREAQRLWAQTPVSSRARILGALRNQIASQACELAELIPPNLARTRADTLIAEVLPLADAARFLERKAYRLLRPKAVGIVGRPLWLWRIGMRREYLPHGLVLVIGPANYPLFLPGVQILQALVAGNAVLIKPGIGGFAVSEFLAQLAAKAGLPDGLFTVLDEDVETAQAAISEGVDKIILTGSVSSGRAVLHQAAEHLTPAILELSGCDAVFILPNADVSKAVDAIAFGVLFNGGATCIAPRRVFVHKSVAAAFQHGLSKRLPQVGSDASLSVNTFAQADEALQASELCPYSLGASVFGPRKAAEQFARRVKAGTVIVNDVIVPTADPRLSFGGSRESGFGKTRGEEGLLEMVVSKTTLIQNGKRLRHLEPPHPRAELLFESYVQFVHGRGFGTRFRAVKSFLAAAKAD